MFGDPWPEEPDEPYVTRFDRDSPGGGGTNAAPELRRAFWGLVAVLNVALLALALGPMLIAFRGEWVAGGLVFVIGVAALAYGVRRYRTYRRDGITRPDSIPDADPEGSRGP